MNVNLISLCILSGLSFAFLILFVVGLAEDDNDKIATGVIALFLLGIFGWLGFGNIAPVSSRYETIPKQEINLVKTKTRLFIEYDDMIRVYTDIHSYNSVDSAKIFWIKKSYNTYGSPAGRNLGFSVDSNDVPKGF